MTLKGFAFPTQFLKIIYYWLQWVFITVHRLSLVEDSGGYSLVAVGRVLIMATSCVAEHKL